MAATTTPTVRIAEDRLAEFEFYPMLGDPKEVPTGHQTVEKAKRP